MPPKKLTLLAAAYATREAKLRADLQQYYGIDLDAARAGGHTAWHVACLVSELPHDARLCVAEDGDAMWTLDGIVLASISNSLNALVYGMSDPKKRGRRPEPIGPSWMRAASGRKLPMRAMRADELMAILERPRG